MKNKLIASESVILWLLFLIGNFLFIDLNLRYWYSFMEQYMMFQTTRTFFFDRLIEPGGLNEYLTQFISLSFVHPLGAAASITLILGTVCLCFHLYLKAFRGRSSMFWAILPALLFWVYPQDSIASMLHVLTALLFAYIYTRIASLSLRYLCGFVFINVSYFLAAPAHLLMALLMAIYECCAKAERYRYWWGFGIVAYSFVLPLVAMRAFYVIPMREAYLSKYLCHPEFPIPLSLLWIGLSFPLLTLLLHVLRGKEWIKNAYWRLVIACVALLAIVVCSIIYLKNPLEQAYRYDFYARQNRWEDIVSHAKEHDIHDLDASVYLNLALSHTGRFIDELLQFPQKGESAFIPHDPRTRMSLIQASEVAWQVGQINAAQRFAFVGVLSSERCIQPRLMKRLVETYLVNGEYRMAEKYIKMLESTPNYREWAMQQRALLNPDVCSSTEWVKGKRAYLPVTDNPFDLTKSLPSALAFLIDDHPDNRAAFEYGMGYLLVHKNLNTLMHYMQLMRDRGEDFPVRYQEAICFYYSAVRKDPKAFNSYPIDPKVKERYLQYAQYARKMPSMTLKSQFGDTYYYYLQFAPNLNN